MMMSTISSKDPVFINPRGAIARGTGFLFAAVLG
jgi:hypothetical protein